MACEASFRMLAHAVEPQDVHASRWLPLDLNVA